MARSASPGRTRSSSRGTGSIAASTSCSSAPPRPADSGPATMPRGRKAMADPKSSSMRVKITDVTLKGVYANQMVVSHTKEEFLLDFVNVFPPEGIVNARIIISPGHLKRVIRALVENVRKYEDRFGEIPEAAEPGRDQIN